METTKYLTIFRDGIASVKQLDDIPIIISVIGGIVSIEKDSGLSIKVIDKDLHEEEIYG